MKNQAEIRKFINDSTALLNSIPAQTGDAARLGHRLSQAIDYLEEILNELEEFSNHGATKPEILEDIADQIGGSIYEQYSGRGMYGKKCMGIVTKEPTECIARAAQHGITGAKWDNMGLDFIVYWPDIQFEAELNENEKE